MLISFPAGSIFAITFNDQNPRWVVPIVVAILALPLVFFGAHTIKHHYSMYGGIYRIVRGRMAVLLGIVCITVYVAVVVSFLLYLR
jgi:hypothetical protein